MSRPGWIVRTREPKSSHPFRVDEGDKEGSFTNPLTSPFISKGLPFVFDVHTHFAQNGTYADRKDYADLGYCWWFCPERFDQVDVNVGEVPNPKLKPDLFNTGAWNPLPPLPRASHSRAYNTTAAIVFYALG